MSIGGPDKHQRAIRVWWGCGGMSISGAGGASAGGQMSIAGTDEPCSSSARIKNENVPKKNAGTRLTHSLRQTEPLQLRSIPGKWIWGLMVKIINFIWEFLKWGDYVGSMCYIEKYPSFPGSAQRKAPSKRA